MLFISITAASAQTLYVSSSGNDSNPGTPQHPIRTISQAKLLKPKSILLKRGDIFYESVSLRGINLGAYGRGPQPEISGLKIPRKGAWQRGIITENDWIPTDTGHIWRANLALEDTCYSGFKTHGRSVYNNVGQIVDLRTDGLNSCQRVRLHTDLKEPFDFYLGDFSDTISADSPELYDHIYAYFDTDPNDISIGLAVYQCGVRAENSAIRDIKVTHWGRCGIVAQSGVTISNCEVDAIGGSYFIEYKSRWLSYGNGIEVNPRPNGCENTQVENCIISRCYDCGYSIQGSAPKGEHISVHNVTIRHSRVEHCCQSFEFFLNGIGDSDKFYDCYVDSCLSISPGFDTGFRYYDHRYMRSHILENSHYCRTGIIYKGNIFVNGNYYCAGRGADGYYDQPTWDKNICYILRGQDLMGGYTGKYDVVTVPTAPTPYASLETLTSEAIAKYRSLTHDEGTEFIIVDTSQKMDNYLKQYAQTSQQNIQHNINADKKH